MNTHQQTGHTGQATQTVPARIPPSRPLSPLDHMRMVSDELARYLRPNPSLPPAVPGQPATQKPHELDINGILQVVRDCSGVLSGIGGFLHTINELGHRTPERNIRSAAVMLPLALYDVHNRRTAGREGQPVRLSQEEEYLLKVYANSHEGNLPIPEWYWPGYPFVQLSSRMENLPGADAYLRESKSLAGTASPLLERFDDLTRRHLEALGKADRFTGEEAAVKAAGKGVALRGADAGATERQRAEGIAAERAKVEREMAGLIDQIRDVRPELMDSVCAEVQLAAALKPELIRATMEAAKGVAEILAYALDPDYKVKKPFNSVVLPQVLVKDHQSSIVNLKLGTSAIQNGIPPEAIAELLTAYGALRHSLTTNFDLLQSAHQPELKRLKAEIEPQLTRIFPIDPESGKRVIAAVLQHSDPAIQQAAVGLLTSRIRITETMGAGKNGTIFESPENVEFLAWAVEILLRGDPMAAGRIRSSLEHSSMQPVVNFTDSVRAAMKKGDVIGVAVTIDDEIKTCKELNTQAPYGRLAALMLAMVAVSHDDQLRRNVKSVLQRLDDVSDIARALTAKLSDKDKASAGFIENSRGNIVRLFSVDLSDYWGYEKIVTEYKDLLENHLLLLRTPTAWRGLNPSDVFLNGHLLFGPPGAGKTFMVQCMANTLGIPLIRVSREEISGAYGEARAEAKFYGETKSLAAKTEERMETKITEFIRKKITDAEAAMRKSQKHACMLFFDEIEGEMVEREIVKNSPDQIALTNAMLRVIEREMSKHPEVIFVAATNHIELVDQAALRPGRFGIHLPIRGPSPEDVATIVRRTLELQGTKFDREADPQFKSLCEEAVGMNPLPIKLAILNRTCVARARALTQGKDEYSVTLEELNSAMQQMKRLSARHIDPEKPNLERDVHGILNALKDLAGNLGLIAKLAETRREERTTATP